MPRGMRARGRTRGVGREHEVAPLQSAALVDLLNALVLFRAALTFAWCLLAPQTAAAEMSTSTLSVSGSGTAFVTPVEGMVEA